MWDESHPRWLLFAGDVMVTATEIKERDERMSVEVKGLADVVRQVKSAISVATTAAAAMQTTANSVVDKINQVNELHTELKQADADLGAAIGLMSNGAPPLEVAADTTNSAPASPNTSPAPVTTGTPDTSVPHAKAQVEQQNAVQATADKYIQKPAS